MVRRPVVGQKVARMEAQKIRPTARVESQAARVERMQRNLEGYRESWERLTRLAVIAQGDADTAHRLYVEQSAFLADAISARAEGAC